jgi:hypothetical protein
MSGMADVILAHTLDFILPLSADPSPDCKWQVECDCDWVEVVSDHRPGEIAHAAHVAQELAKAGYGSMHDASAKVKGDSPLGRIRLLIRQLDNWESEGHSTVGIGYLRRHFAGTK